MFKHFMHNLWLWKCGLKENKVPYDMETIALLNWVPEFIKLMLNRMVFGWHRYGWFLDAKEKHYDRLGSIRYRLDKFEETGNTEYLVDCSNLCMIEFKVSKHPKKHFLATDDGHHTPKVRSKQAQDRADKAQIDLFEPMRGRK